MNSLAERSTPGRARPSQPKMTSCVPSRGMSVSVDLASLGVGQGHHSGPLPWTLLLFSAPSAHQGLAPGVTEPSPTRMPRDGLPGGRK